MRELAVSRAEGREVAVADHALPPSFRRLARAVLQLEAEQLGDGRWSVTGGAGPHIVDADASSCDCPDHVFRHKACAHLLRVRLALGGEQAIAALRALLPPPTARRPRNAPTKIVGRELTP